MIETRRERKRRGNRAKDSTAAGGRSRKNRRAGILASSPYMLAIPAILMAMGIAAGLLAAGGVLP